REPDQALLTRRYTEHAINFIKNNINNPFFLYMAYNAPHVPLYASKRFQGSTNRGPYGDVVHELDWSVGQVLKTLKKQDLQENTFIIFYSDNGPWLVYGDYGGTAFGFREGKVTTFEGGHRVPAIAMWPGKIHADRVSDIMVT